MCPYCNGRGCPFCNLSSSTAFHFGPSPGEIAQKNARRNIAIDFCEQQKMQVASEELLTIIADAIQYGIALAREGAEAVRDERDGSMWAFLEIE